MSEPSPRVRKQGDGPLCPVCALDGRKSDMFVENTHRVRSTTHPRFCAPIIRIRYYKCGDPACGWIEKRAIPVT